MIQEIYSTEFVSAYVMKKMNDKKRQHRGNNIRVSYAELRESATMIEERKPEVRISLDSGSMEFFRRQLPQNIKICPKTISISDIYGDSVQKIIKRSFCPEIDWVKSLNESHDSNK